MAEQDQTESETVVEVTGVSVSLPVERTEVPESHHLRPGEPFRGSPGEGLGGFAYDALEPAVPASYGEPVEPYSGVEGVEAGYRLLEPGEPFSGEAPEYDLLEPAVPAEPVRPADPGLPPLEPMTVSEHHVVVYEEVPAGDRAEPEPADPGLPPLEPLKATKYVVSVREVPAHEGHEPEPAIPAQPVDPGIPPGDEVPAEPATEPKRRLMRVQKQLLTPDEDGRQLRKLLPMTPARPVMPAQPGVPAVPAEPAQVWEKPVQQLETPAQPQEAPVQPLQPRQSIVAASAPPTPEGTVEEPAQPGSERQQPPPAQQPPPGYQPPPAQHGVPAQQPPASQPPAQEPPAQQPPPTQTSSYLTGDSSTPGGGYNFPGMPTGFGSQQVPPNGDVGPDPNIQFDEAQYTALIAVIGEIKAGARKAITHNDVYLDAELQLQPMNQTWEPAQKLVKWGGNFGGTVDTENKNLRKKLTQLESGLEKAKVVFKDTDDLAAYDVTKFTTEFPGFTGGTGAV
ncbi:hypothetical protein LZ318_24860 [Saccharopolyspora indica]|uniref:hypothetical protein n=1 Tax=Saccharopolyspora indica TaxID=1229659 RepID=UPI0022EB7335|nr:hypothetical protein [Saccharopolyspora indica]MDA3649898.1 hypothetical protein [Saccharopolyspora indica]